jgi:hypothetical protein
VTNRMQFSRMRWEVVEISSTSISKRLTPAQRRRPSSWAWRIAVYVAIAVTGANAISTQAAAQEADIDALLRLHHLQRVAHVLGDARLLTAPFAAGFVEVSDGRISMPSPAAAQARFERYLAGVRFLEWEDVRPPRIRISPHGDWAEVIVQKRVRTIPDDTLRSTVHSSDIFAWSGRWVHADSTWRLQSMVSTHASRPATSPYTLAEYVGAHHVLGRARRAVGGDAAVAHIAMLHFVAQCGGPGGPYVTEVASAKDGRVAFIQRFPTRRRFAAGIGLAGPWQQEGSGTVRDSLGVELETVVTAHELHLLAIAPETRFSAPVARANDRIGERGVDVVQFTDRLGAAVDFLYDTATGLPLGFRPVNHTGQGAAEILTTFDDWRAVGDIRLPYSIAIQQGHDLYRCRIMDASVDWLPDDRFRAQHYHTDQ